MKKVFLDTPILLDYFENRNRKISTFIQNLIDNQSIQVNTSYFNITET